MKMPQTPDDRLLRNLLVESEVAEPDPTSPHPDDEMLALFAEGALDPNERKELTNHLADCSHCRQVASQLLLLSAESATMSPSSVTAESSRTSASSAGWHTRRVMWMALAASLLLAVGLLLIRSGSDPQVAEARTYNSARKLLEDGQFDEARQLLSSSADKKIASARLNSLRSQAVREMPSLFALASAGRLTDFGFNPIAGPIFKDFMTDPAELARQLAAMPVGKGAQAARDLLAESKSDEAEVLLNRGHALLSLGDLASAAAEFQRAIEVAPQQSLSWLGLGLARFMQSRYADAEAAFREALRMAPESFPAAMNLAMALDEQGKTKAALTVWKQQLDRPLASADRQLVEQAIKRLQKP